MVVQVAASSKCSRCIGIEKADYPSEFAVVSFKNYLLNNSNGRNFWSPFLSPVDSEIFCVEYGQRIPQMDEMVRKNLPRFRIN